MGGTGVIDNFLGVFTSYIDSGFGLLGGEVAFIATTLIVIDVTLAALFWSWGADEDIIARLVKKTLFVGVFAYIIGNWNNLARIIFESFAGLGLKASGDVTVPYPTVAPNAFTIHQDVKTQWLFTARPRVGYAFDRTLLYVTGGVAVTELKYNAVFSDVFGNGVTGSVSKTVVGWTVGGGIEYAFAKNVWSAPSLQGSGSV